jgi:hypothetical protein
MFFDMVEALDGASERNRLADFYASVNLTPKLPPGANRAKMIEQTTLAQQQVMARMRRSDG